MADIFDKYSHGRPDINPMIYAYADHVPEHVGMLKVGYTEIDVDKRVAQQFPTMTPDGKKPYDILVRETALYADGSNFTDHDVHRMLVKRGVERMGTSEWFRCSVQDVLAAIIAVKVSSVNLENRRVYSFGMRPEQAEAVSITKKYFETEIANNPQLRPKFLWNCKMRFGKTFTAYELAKSMGLQKILVLTFKPAVESAWEEDLLTHVDFQDWQYYSREKHLNEGLTPEKLNPNKPIVCFGSFQDFLGTDASGGIKPKNEWVHTTNWDLVIFDEYHFGAWRENAKKLFETENEDSYDSLDIEKYKSEEADNAYNESFLPITTKYYLYLSGTPFRSLNTGEFIENQIYSWTYSDEQRAKAKWAGPEPNPYAPLPQMVLMTYKLPDSIRSIAMNSVYNEFDLNLFFSAKTDTGKQEDSQFIYKEYVQRWLDLIRGAYLPPIDELKQAQGERPVMPYSDVRLRSTLLHTLWFLPGVNSCFAMANLLREPQNAFYSNEYKINVCAGIQAGIGLDALTPVRKSMENPLESKTITLSCGKLTTGVTVKPWSGIMMLRNLSSPETYFQAAFRVQSPWEVGCEDGSTQIMKQECYVFDFALDRALKQVSDYGCRLNVKESNPEKKIGEFINFLPVLAYDGSSMKPIDAKEILDITMSGTSATLLARRWESAMLVNVDNATLQRLLDNPEAMAALMSIEGFRSLNQDISTIINKSESVKKAKKEAAEKGKDLTSKEKKELTEEEKEYKSRRKQIQEKLIKFATRVPIFMYLTDYREYSLKDVITQFEPGLFKKVTGLDIKDFELLVSLGLFNDELMNDAVYNFKRYEDSSLEYAGIRMHAENEDVGLFSTVISKADYDSMAQQQGLSMKPIESAFKKVEPKKTIKESAKYGTIKPVEIKVAEDKSKSEESIPHIEIGYHISHRKFGPGIIVEISDSSFTVQFAEGRKTLSTSITLKNGIVTLTERER